jgi:hypothetical protein
MVEHGVEYSVETNDVMLRVYRTWGEPQDAFGSMYQNPSGPWGASWTPDPLETIGDIRFDGGLPPQNAARFLTEGLVNAKDILFEQAATRIGSNPGGLSEFIIPNAERVVQPLRVIGLNEGFTLPMMSGLQTVIRGLP